MKKTLLASATLLALSGAASAQSTLNLYGLLDLSIESVKLDKSVTRISSDNYASSRLGFRGVEDLGDGLKAKFVLETAVKGDLGSNGGGTARFWDRSAWVGLEGGFGEIRLGRIDSSIGLLAGNSNILGAQAYDDFKIAKTWAGDKYRRVDNSITYYIPKFVDGLTAQIQYTLAAGTSSAAGTETTGDDTGKGYSLNAQYAAGPFAIGAGYINIKANTSGSVEDSAALAFTSYDFGVVKLIGYYDVDSRSGKAEAKKLLGFKVNAPITDAFSISAGWSKVKNAINSSGKDDASIIALRANYNLSKRTALYGLVTTIDNQDLSTLGIGATTVTKGENSHGIAFGVRHSF